MEMLTGALLFGSNVSRPFRRPWHSDLGLRKLGDSARAAGAEVPPSLAGPSQLPGWILHEIRGYYRWLSPRERLGNFNPCELLHEVMDSRGLPSKVKRSAFGRWTSKPVAAESFEAFATIALARGSEALKKYLCWLC